MVFGATGSGKIRNVSNWKRNAADGTAPMAAQAATRSMHRVLDSIGIDETERKRRHIVLHGGRHTFASLAVERVSVFAAQRLTGHRDIRVLQGYAHPEAEEVRRFGTVLDADFGKTGSQGE